MVNNKIKLKSLKIKTKNLYTKKNIFFSSKNLKVLQIFFLAKKEKNANLLVLPRAQGQV